MDSMDALGLEELQRRWRKAKDHAARDAFTFFLDPREFRTVPTDWFPRLIPQEHWETISQGVAQRLKAINHFLGDLYHGQQDIVPPDVMFSCQYYNPELQGFKPLRDTFVHIYGIDLVHMGDGRYVILEDNLRIPSGITYQTKSVEIGLETLCRSWPRVTKSFPTTSKPPTRKCSCPCVTTIRPQLRAADRQQVWVGLL